MSLVPRRAFLRSLGLAAAAAACTRGSSPPTAASGSPTATVSPSPSASASVPAEPAWRRIPGAGPSARRDATLTGDARRGLAYLFGGRSGASTTLDDLWVFDVAATRWEQVRAPGTPRARFGHSAGIVGGKLVVFGGQSGPSTFFDDIHIYDPDARRWSAGAGGRRPAARYGAGETVVEDRLFVSHGFTHSGRFDDTWSWNRSWTDASPGSGVRPVKRCLHRAVWWPEQKVVALFAGQTDGRPFLNDLWFYDPAGRSWREVSPGTVPGPRTLFGMAVLSGRLWVWGGFGPGGEVADVWSLDDPAGDWRAESFDTGPGPRGGVAVATVSGDRALMFGGRAGDRDLDELWSFRPLRA